MLDLNDTVSGLLQMLPRAIGEHIQTTIRLAPDLAKVKADASQMEQVLVNLVLNARDAMPEGGELTIETSNVTLTEPRLRVEGLGLRPGFYVMLSIIDTGVGMDAATRERAFEPFFTTKPQGKGTGLGLATVYGIVDQSGGGVSLESGPGLGTIVRIYLPATTAIEPPRAPEVQRISKDAGTETVLLVEDNEAVRDLTARALRRRGYTVHEARDGEERPALDADQRRQAASAGNRCRDAWPQRTEPCRAPHSAQSQSARAVHVRVHRRRRCRARKFLGGSSAAAETVHSCVACRTRPSGARRSDRRTSINEPRKTRSFSHKGH